MATERGGDVLVHPVTLTRITTRPDACYLGTQFLPCKHLVDIYAGWERVRVATDPHGLGNQPVAVYVAQVATLRYASINARQSLNGAPEAADKRAHLVHRASLVCGQRLAPEPLNLGLGLLERGDADAGRADSLAFTFSHVKRPA